MTRENRMVPYNHRNQVATAGAAGAVVANQIKQVAALAKQVKQAYDFVAKNMPKKQQQKSLRGSPESMEIRAPVAAGTIRRSGKQTVNNTKRGVRIRDAELLISAIPGSIAWTVQNVLALNPGLAASFPRLSAEAVLYEQYVFHSLWFEYIPIAPTSTQGTFSMSPDYNPTGPLPTSEVIASDHSGTVTGPVWCKNALHFNRSEMFANASKKYIRSGGVNSDLKNYDAGQLITHTVNEIGTGAIGKLWVHYDVEFFVPVINQVYYPSNWAEYYTTVGQAIPTNTPTNLNQLSPVYASAYNSGITLTSNSTFVFPSGVYSLQGVVDAFDTVNEIFQIQAVLYNSTQAAIVLQNMCTNGLGTAGATQSVELLGSFRSNGTDQYVIRITLIGTSGTLTVNGGIPALMPTRLIFMSL